MSICNKARNDSGHKRWYGGCPTVVFRLERQILATHLAHVDVFQGGAQPEVALVPIWQQLYASFRILQGFPNVVQLQVRGAPVAAVRLNVRQTSLRLQPEDNRDIVDNAVESEEA